VARQEGSLIVNSSQGGGSKDTWVVSGAVTDPVFPDVAPATGAVLGRVSPAEPANRVSDPGPDGGGAQEARRAEPAQQ
jgi:hypothetical protein